MNTDFGVADVTKTWSATELEPYRRLNAAGKLDAVMVGHVVNGRIDAAYPASLSRATLDRLRNDIGFDGPAVTDDMQAAAITQRYGADEAVLLALEAGNDLLLFANQQVYDAGIVGARGGGGDGRRRARPAHGRADRPEVGAPPGAAGTARLTPRPSRGRRHRAHARGRAALHMAHSAHPESHSPRMHLGA